MKVRDLKEILKDIPPDMTTEEFDELNVLIPSSMEFDGLFLSPCLKETGIGELGLNEEGDIPETMKSFVIVPCGFFEERHGVPPELN